MVKYKSGGNNLFSKWIYLPFSKCEKELHFFSFFVKQIFYLYAF